MKTHLLFASSLLLAPLSGCAQPSKTETPPPVAQIGSAVSPRPSQTTDNQRLYGSAERTLISPETSQKIVDDFRANYGAASAPRIVIYVNRELVDATSGFKQTGQTERYERRESKQQSDMTGTPPTNGAQTQVNVTVGGTAGATSPPQLQGKGTASQSSTTTTGENIYQWQDPTQPTLADRQTMREVERLFGRAFRTAGAKLADQRTAAALLPEDEGHSLRGEQAAKDREALARVADIAIEILISSRNLTIPEISGDKTYAVPDLQATAIRLKDSAIIGQASASDVLGQDRFAGRIVQQFDVRDITEATALALMEDMLRDSK